MTAVPIISGVTANQAAEFQLSYPLNLEPIIVDSKISKGQLRHTAGTEPFADGPGIMRAAIVWNNLYYAVMGEWLVSVSSAGLVTQIGSVGASGTASLDYSFDHLIIRSGITLWYWDGVTLAQVTDTDLGAVVDSLWIDGYTMATDGTYILVTEINDPFQVKPLKYASAEADPDPIVGLIKLRGEVYALGSNTIQVFQNVGGSGFPFQVVDGATIPTGCVGTQAKVLFGETFAFVGSSRSDAIGVHVAGSATSSKISVRAVDDALARVADPSRIVLEKRISRDELRLLVHLPDETWVFLAKASEKAGEAVWYRCQSGVGQSYRIRNAVFAYNRFLVGDTTTGAIGSLRDTATEHFGESAQWQFDAGFLYNQTKGTIVDRVELVGLPGRGSDAAGSSVFLSYTRDGETFTPERAVSAGRTGERTKRIEWRPHARMRNYLGFRFRGYSAMAAGWAACEVTARPLNV
jgi:hypothetical protein